MQNDLTPAEKRKQTMRLRYGEKWRDVIGQAAKEAKEAKHGEDGYKAIQGKAGRAGGGKPRPASRPFTKNRKLAKKAGAKGLEKRWGQNDTAKND